MEIVVNDTNILIDLYSIEFLEQFFKLPIIIHTVDFVINEIKDAKQKAKIAEYINCNLLKVHKFTAEELVKVVELCENASGNVSLTDCSVWYYAMQNKYILLTGDRQLRAKAINTNVTVKGIIYVFDSLVEHRIVAPKLAADKLEELFSINQRLPQNLIQERIDTWRK